MEAKKNILILTTIGGFLQEFEMNDVKLLQSQGWNVHYASNFHQPIYECDTELLQRMGVTCHQIDIRKSPLAVVANIKAFRQLIQIIENEEITAVHCHNPMGGVLGRMTKLYNRHLYVIYTAHGFHFYKHAPIQNWLLYYPAERLLARLTNRLITINREDEIAARKFKLSSGGVVSRIPGVGLNMERFEPDQKARKDTRQKYDIADDRFVILSVGELNRNKNHETLIRAVDILKKDYKRFLEMNPVLMICGEGGYREKLQELIQECHLDDNVILCGYQVQIERYYQAADCFAFPSYREGLGMAALEAMACGMPLIVSDNRGTREYSRNNQNALVCPARDAEAFAKAIAKMWENDKKREEMSQRSRKIADDFSVSHTERIMQKIYSSIGQ